MKRAVIAISLLALLTACAQPPRALDAETPTVKAPLTDKPTQLLVPDGYTGRYQADVTVLEDASHGPQLCFAVATSLPPQCGGTDIVGWSWKKVKHESIDKTRWGSYRVTGTYDGTRFTLTEVSVSLPDSAANAEPPMTRERGERTPCAEPPGGWSPVDPALTSSEAFEAASAMAQSSPDYAGLWIDQGDQVSESAANNPEVFVLNVAYTKDIAAHAAELRTVWGGALCVSPAKYSEADLMRIQQEIMSVSQPQSSGIDVYTNSLQYEVMIAFESDQRDLDAKYGPGAVYVSSLLRPID